MKIWCINYITPEGTRSELVQAATVLDAIAQSVAPELIICVFATPFQP